MLNVIIHGFDGPMGTQTLAKAFDGIEIGSCFVLSRYAKDAAAVRAKSYVFHGPSAFDFVDWNAIRPIDEELVEQMRHCEAVVMEMFTRRETDGRFFSYMQRKRTYLQLLRYWSHLLEEQNVCLFLSYNIPHFDDVYVLYCLCKLRHIPVILCDPANPLRDTTLLLDDWEKPSPELKERFHVLLDQRNIVDTAQLPHRFEAYVEAQNTEKTEEKRKPWYCRTKLFLKPPWSRSPLHRGYMRRQMRYIANVLRTRKMFRFYDEHALPPDLSRRFIYIPLHLQPECSTCPLAGAYVNQELIIQMLGALVPDDVLLYVKEHPFQEEYRPDGMCRSPTFYRDILAVRNVRFVPRTFSSYDLIENCIAVAIGTGTAGFEALFRGKPALMFGHRFHELASGIFPVRTLNDCSQALRAILQEGKRPAHNDIRLFLRALNDVAVHGYAELAFRPSTELSDDVNAQHVGAALQEKIRSINNISLSCT